MLSFDRYSRDDVIGEVLLPVSEALESSAVIETSGVDAEKNIGNQSDAVLIRDIAPRSLKVSTYLLPRLGLSISYDLIPFPSGIRYGSLTARQ